MILALMLGKKNSSGFPGKNLFKVNGRHLCEYPLLAASKTKSIDLIYVSTDCPNIMKVATKYNANIIPRPRKLATKKALGEDAFQHGYFYMKKDLKLREKDIEFIVLLFANAPTINAKLINQGINILRKNKKYDSAVTTSIYNMWSPIRARKLNKKGNLEPFVPFKTFGDPNNLNCDRDSQGDVHYADMSVSIVRPYCLENMKSNLLPQRWMGKKIAPILSDGGCDVDFPWQIPMVEYWLKDKGVT